MCSVVTNLVTSLEVQPIRCATTLFLFGRTRNVYVATRIILRSSTAENSATSGYVVAPESSGQSDAWAGGNPERASRKPSLFPSEDLIDAACKDERFFAFINFILHTLNYFFNCILVFFLYGNLFDLLFVIIYCVGAGITNLTSISDGSDPYFFPSKDGKDAVREGRNGRRSVYFPLKLAYFPL